jgi:hypothetical protein
MSEMNELIKLIKNCKTMPELDNFRLDIVTIGAGRPGVFQELQKEFKKKKNQLERIPSIDRNW